MFSIVKVKKLAKIPGGKNFKKYLKIFDAKSV